MPLYRKIYTSYWSGELARSLEGNTDAHAVAFYLMTCPESNRIGCYRKGLATIAEALGIDNRRASEALVTLEKIGFLAYDKTYRMVFVRRFARHEFGDAPRLSDNRVKALINDLPDMVAVCPGASVWAAFNAEYESSWGAIFEALPEPFGTTIVALRDDSPTQEQYQEQKQDLEEKRAAEPAPSVPTPGYAATEYSGMTPKPVRIDPRVETVMDLYDELRPGWCKTAKITLTSIKWSLSNRSLIKSALVNHDLENILIALENVTRSGYHMGTREVNGTTAGPRLAPEHIFKRNSKIDSISALLELGTPEAPRKVQFLN